ncbi:MAG: tetratricopeptide repeat protein [Opitutaceae bacterium]|nr:tetratricopeptide repeat protein [Opitutaceae bacterium]
MRWRFVWLVLLAVLGSPTGIAADLAVKIVRSAAEKGDVEAQCAIAAAYFEGTDGLPQDRKEAARFFRMAADQGHATAQWFLANMYAEGEGGLPKDQAESLKWMRQAAQGGDADAQYAIGLSSSWDAVGKQDFAEAVRWFRQAAEQGHDGAQYRLGVHYEHGLGVAKDTAEAEKLFRKAIFSGLNPDAMFRLAGINLEGDNGPRDLVEAWAWFNLARKVDHKHAAECAAILEEGIGHDQNIMVAVAKREEALEQQLNAVAEKMDKEEAALAGGSHIEFGLIPRDIPSFFRLLFGLVVVPTTMIWVIIDSKRIGVRKGVITGWGNMGRWTWVILCILFWAGAFPLYLLKRRDFIAANQLAPEAKTPEA